MQVAFVASYAVLWALVVIQSLVLLGVVQALHKIRTEGVPNGFDSRAQNQLVGAELPKFEETDLDGNAVRSSDFRGQSKIILVVSPDCQSCAGVLEDMTPLRSRGKEVVILCRGEKADCRSLAARHGLTVPVIADANFSISALLHIDGVPTAVAINSDGIIKSFGRPDSFESLEQMVPSAAT